MAAQGKLIKNKMASVKNIRKITKTMEMVSVAKMRRTVEQAVKSKYFTGEAYEMLAMIANRNTVKNHRLFQVPEKSKKELVVIIASNKGMCGGYNTNVAKQVRNFLSTKDLENISVITVGKQADKIARRMQVSIIASFAHFSENLSIQESLGLSRMILSEFETGNYESISFIATEFIKAMEYQVQTIPLLPISLELSKKYSAGTVQEIPQDAENYLFEPSTDQVIDTVVPRLVNAIVYQILLDAFASEHSSRMVAMKNATDNAGTLLDDLTLTFNQVRQAGITQELSEIVAGASALH